MAAARAPVPTPLDFLFQPTAYNRLKHSYTEVHVNPWRLQQGCAKAHRAGVDFAVHVLVIILANICFRQQLKDTFPGFCLAPGGFRMAIFFAFLAEVPSSALSGSLPDLLSEAAASSGSSAGTPAAASSSACSGEGAVHVGFLCFAAGVFLSLGPFAFPLAAADMCCFLPLQYCHFYGQDYSRRS